MPAQFQNKRWQSNAICADFNHELVWWSTATFKHKTVLKKYNFFSFSVCLTRFQSCNQLHLYVMLIVSHTKIFLSPEGYLQYHLLTEIQCLLKNI